MAKGIIGRARQEVADRCGEMFEEFCRTEGGRLPEKLYVHMRARWSSGRGTIWEKDAPEVQLVIPQRISYTTPGQLSGEVEGHDISVSNDGEGHFRGVLNGKPYDSLSITFVEEKLKVPIQKKKSGSQAGYPSEPVPRAVWRHLADRYNDGDPTVRYERRRGMKAENGREKELEIAMQQNEELTTEDVRHLVDWGLQKSITWMVLVLTCFVGLVEILPEIKSYGNAGAGLVLKWLVPVGAIILLVGLGVSIYMVFRTLDYMGTWQRKLPPPMVKELDETFSRLHWIFFPGPNERMRKWIVWGATFGVPLIFLAIVILKWIVA